MASYSIDFKPSIDKDLRRLPRDLISRVMEKIEVLKSEPFPPQAVKIPVADRLYRIRVGDYRIVYEIIDDPEQFYGEIPELQGVWATGKTLEACRDDLMSARCGELSECLILGCENTTENVHTPEATKTAFGFAAISKGLIKALGRHHRYLSSKGNLKAGSRL